MQSSSYSPHMNGDAATIGINGFGRIGRSVLRAALANPLVKVTAINDPYISPEYAAYLLSSDASAAGSGTLDIVAEAKEGAIVVNGSFIEVFHRTDPTSIPWRVSHVVDCSGVYTTHERAGQHLASGASRVIVANVGADIPTFVVGVNEDRFLPSMQVIGAGSPTGVVLAATLKLLADAGLKLEFASFTAVHAATNQQKVVNGVNVKDWAAARAANNTICFATGAQRTLQKVLPSVAPVVVGTSYHVPTTKGCVLDLTVQASGSSLNKSLIEMALLGGGQSSSRSSPPLLFIPAGGQGMVSSDVEQKLAKNSSSSAIGVYDGLSAQILGEKVAKFSVWYDNEASYARAVIALVVSTNSKW